MVSKTDKALNEMVQWLGLEDADGIREAKKYIKNIYKDFDPDTIEIKDFSTELCAFHDGYRLAHGKSK